VQARSPVFSAAALTARDILGGLILAVSVGGSIDTLHAVLPIFVSRGLAIVAGVVVIFGAIRIWTRDMARIARGPETTVIGRGGALALTALIGATGVTLGLAEPFAVSRGALFDLRIDQVYTLLFVPATLLISTAGAFLIGRTVGDAGFATRLAVSSGIVSAAAFLAVDLFMDAIGWRVGAPGAGQRATMIVVTTLGVAIAGITAGGVIGAFLARSSSRSQ
jgi:hypothetical protein